MTSCQKFPPIYLYATIAALVGILAVASEVRPFAVIFVLIFFGLLNWSLGEYLLHRFAFHGETPCNHSRGYFYIMHLGHHDDPQSVDQLFVSFWMSAPTAIVYCLLAWGILGNWRSVAYLFIGLVIGYTAYELLHYQAHHGRPKLRLFKYLRKYHQLHHGETPNLRFGVTSPLFDYLFGTFQPVNTRKV
jgi:dihydroceramide fatty acyl 2-hydroxylase